MEGGITRFSSGIAGVAVVLFALMGTIGVGYLLNGSTGLQTVNDYDYVTDVSGLYSYTPVPAYAAYSPATNNYQYSESLDDLGKYTSGISYTPAGAANLNPIITPSSGTHVNTGTIDYLDLVGQDVSPYFLLRDATGTKVPAKIIPLSTIVNGFGTFTTATVDIPSPESLSFSNTSGSATLTAQTVGIRVTTSDTWVQAVNFAANNSATAAGIDTYMFTTACEPFTYTTSGGTATQMANVVGAISDLTINANGTTTFTYTSGGSINEVTRPTSSIELIAWDAGAAGWNGTAPSISWSATNTVGVDYLDPNAGVSLDSSPVYWGNGNDLGSVTWAFKKPTAAASIRVAQLTAGGQTMNEFVVSWSGTMWQMSYLAPGGAQTSVDLGSGWQAVYVRAFYTGELQTGPIDGFFNFTSYTLGPATTYATSYTGNVPIDHCQISGSTTMKFACIGTTVESGTVPGAMFDATFTASTWFPELASVRVSFDSAAYVGSAVRVGSWTMAVDSGTFIGDLQDVDGIIFRADLTQPWAVTWNPGSTSVSLTFTPYQQAGTQTITILADDDSRTVNLDGQWAIDTDLYSVGTHIEEVYEWNFGNWGLDKEQFIVCAMGLTALLAIAFKLARVPFHALDFVVIFLGNLILWVIM